MGKFNLLRRIKNHMYYTVCMEGNEEAVNVFRVCNDRVKGILCYQEIFSKISGCSEMQEHFRHEELDIWKLNLIKINDKEYLICPKAVKFWDEDDLNKYKSD